MENKVMPLGEIVKMKYVCKEVLCINLNYTKYDIKGIFKVENKEIKSRNELEMILYEKQNQIIECERKNLDGTSESKMGKVLRIDERIYLLVNKASKACTFTLTYYDPLTNTIGSMGHLPGINSNDKCFIDLEGVVYESIETILKIINKDEILSITTKKMGDDIIGKTKQFLTRNVVIEPTKDWQERCLAKEAYQIENGSINLLEKAFLLNNFGGEMKKYPIKILTEKDGIFYFEFLEYEPLGNNICMALGMSGSPIVQNDKIIGAAWAIVTRMPKNVVGRKNNSKIAEGIKIQKMMQGVKSCIRL